MSAGPISHRAPPDQQGGAAGGTPDAAGGGAPGPDRLGDPRFEAIKEKLKQIGPWVGYSTFFLFSLLLFAYWTFPYDRLRDRIVADFAKSQRVPPGGARQSLSIGSLEPSWFTGVVLKDVELTNTPADPTKPSSVMRADEVRARVSFGTLFSAAKDLTISAKALGGTIDATITNKKSATPPKPGDKGDKYDRTIHVEVADVALNDVAPLRDAIGAKVGGTLKGSIDLVLLEGRADKSTGSIQLELADFGLPGEPDADAKGEYRVHFKVPALKLVFGTDQIALPPIAIGTVPIAVTVKNGVAKIDKFSATGKDVDLNLDGQITLREATPESDVNVGLRFKFNDSYKKKTDSAAAVLTILDNEPKLKAGKRPDGFYGLRLSGLLGAALVVSPNPNGGPAMGMPGMPPIPAMPHSP